MPKIDLHAHHPILDIQNHMVFANNGNVVLCYELALPEVYSLSESDYEELHGIWFQAFKSLPTGTVIHKQDLYQKVRFDAKDLPNNTFLQKATHNHFKGREYLSHQSHLFFILPLDKALNASKYVNPFRKAENGLHRKLDVPVAEFITAVNDAVSFINNSQRISLVPLAPADILTHANDYYNGFNQDFDTDILLSKKHIEIGDHYFDAIAVNNGGCFAGTVQSSKINEKFTSDDFGFHQGFIDGLGLDLNENHIINHILYLDDKHKWRTLLDKKVEELSKSSNFGSQNKVVLKKVRHILDQINTDDSSRIIRGHLNIIFWHPETEHLKRIGSKIKAEFKELDIVPYHPNGEERKHYFLNSHPCHATNFSNEDLYVTDLKHALCLYINNTSYRSDDSEILFNDRQHNIPVLKDVWDEQKQRIKARNFAIFAPTGEGKSFLANNILRQYFETGVRLVIIDLGGSYTKFASLYPEQCTVLRYENGKSLGINPFYISNSEDVTPERLEDLSLFLFELMGVGTKPQKENSVALKKILLAYYRESKVCPHALEGFYNFVSKHQKDLLSRLQIDSEYFNVKGFLHILSEYVGEGLYSFLFGANEDQSYR